MQSVCDGNIHAIVDAVCQCLSQTAPADCQSFVQPLCLLSSRHLRAAAQWDAGPHDLRVLEFIQAVAPLLQQYDDLRQKPIAWRGDTPDAATGPVTSGLMATLWSIVERHAPGFLAYPQVVTQSEMPPMTRTTCAMCCADMQGTTGTCDVCSTVLYEVSMNNMYQNHHTLGGTGVSASKTTLECVLSPPTAVATNEASVPNALRNAVGSAGAVYQRRAQFRMALASYQGRATRSVPTTIVESVRKHIETIAFHLVDTSYSEADPVGRYARVTRVHVMCILRGTDNSKYSKWYRESHYLHFMITRQQPPDLGDSENILVLMFGMGIFSRYGNLFFCTSLPQAGKERKNTHMADQAGRNADVRISSRLYKPDQIDGKKIWMVATECIMTFFALLYAFPHIPGALLDDVYETEDAGESQWFSVTSTAALRAAMEAILQTSEVLLYSLADGKTMTDVTKDVVSDINQLSDMFGLQLNERGVPATCRQMFDYIVAVYTALNNTDITTREELWALYQRYQLIPVGYQLPGLARMEVENRSALIRFCSELAVQWMQPYFSQHPVFYMPTLAPLVNCKRSG
jgi:hypothetical protein